MLARIFKGFEFKALGIGIIAYRWDVEVSVGPLAVAAMWGRMPITHLHDNAVNFNVQQFNADLEKLPPAMREKLLANWKASLEWGDA